VAIYAAFESHRHLKEREVRAAQLESQLATSQLAALKAQLHPHFLFNTLHSISMLNFVDADAANRVLVQLSDLLRLTLDRSRALELPLRDEIDFVDRYLAIEQTRFDDRLDVHLELDDDVMNAMVPNLILQPLVENALRHGIAPDSTAGRLNIRARRDGSALVLEVADDGPGLPANWSLDRDAGIGLSNVRDRLAAAYDRNASLALEPMTPRGTTARVRMPFVVSADIAAPRSSRRAPALT
jgi:LytS/YehU family sensor histidine kinase